MHTAVAAPDDVYTSLGAGPLTLCIKTCQQKPGYSGVFWTYSGPSAPANDAASVLVDMGSSPNKMWGYDGTDTFWIKAVDCDLGLVVVR